ncbi:unnamed protein product [Rotaria socialis]|uniref:G-protein coupled receptors family 1 profile domain-containing protein n=1 Tax=Rotaria socialis TaxID=392032 RepID=A0A818DN58_9BILA|nr:unnamed protein product [Rotaria socialis]CAF3720244.1 unnamed protein product [Rotaria socialis]CAF4191725.1 unnamed protein product [Rotaria socialis]CAF4261951.1 unnamed protein product [Rotaria socialis]
MNQTSNALSNVRGINISLNCTYVSAYNITVNGTLNCVNQSLHFPTALVSYIVQNQSLVNSSAITHTIISPQVTKFILILLVSFMTFVTVSGNLLVIIAFLREPTIRTYSNYFILNLSIADLLIGLICIPLYSHKVIFGKWYLGYHICKLWLVFDYVVGSASTLCIVVISYDRYLMVSKGLNYLSDRSIRRALKFVFSTWIIAILNYGPAIIIWDLLPGSEQYQDHICEPPFATNFPYLVTTAFVEFFGPFFTLMSLNLLVYLNIRQRSRGIMRTNRIRLKHNGHHTNLTGKTTEKAQKFTSQIIFTKSTSLTRDRKAAKSLFILVFAFVICWCPYTLLTLIRAVCTYETTDVSSFIYEMTFWLLWLNSTINPLLYSFLHVKFREAFYRILCSYKHQNRHQLRSDQV